MFFGLDCKVIYGLLDPRDGIIRYVGSTSAPHKRYTEHLQMPKRDPPQKNKWVKEMLDQGVKPIFVFLSSVHHTQVKDEEHKWIEHFSKYSVLINYKIKKNIA